MLTPLFLVSSGDRPPLRVAVLLDGFVMPRYVATILADIARSNFVNIELVILHRRAGLSGAGAVLALGRRLSGVSYQIYMDVDKAMGGDGEPLALVDAEVALAGVDCLEVSSNSEAEELRLSPDAIDEIRRRGVDVILRFCEAVPRGAVLQAARHGVWSYRYGDDEHLQGGGAPFLRQIFERAATLDVSLEVLGDAPSAGIELCRSRFGKQSSMFVTHSRQIAIWETIHFMLWKLHELHDKGWEHMLRRSSVSPRPRSDGRPTNFELTRLFAPRILGKIKERLRARRGSIGRWMIGIRHANPPLASLPEGALLSEFRWYEPPPRHFWADPFLVQRKGTTYLFFEDFDYDRGYARISRAELHHDGSLGEVVGCLDRGYHMSYPFVFEHHREMFMIPESTFDGTVTLYRARRFPDEWVQEKILFRGNAADTTLFWKDGLFYFFTTLYERDDRGMTTMLFVADSLTGAWRLHPASPVSTDIREARQAGGIFRHAGRLFRPSQNCGPHYGYGFNLQEIVTLTEDQYEERHFRSIDPSLLPIPSTRVHTYNLCGHLEVIDCAAAASLHPHSDALPSMFEDDDGPPSSRAHPHFD